LIDRWAQLAAERPWRWVAIWALGIAAANLGLRLLLNDLSLARNAPLAILTAVGFLAFAWVYTAQLTRSSRGQGRRAAASSAVPKPSCAARWRSGLPGRLPAAGWGASSQRLWSCPRPVNAPVGRFGRPTGQSTSRRRRLALAGVAAVITLALLVDAVLADLLKGEVTMCSSQAGGIEGHQWTLHRTSGTRLPCRIVCQCGWISTAGQHTTVLLQLKGHLEDSLRNGAQLLRGHDQPSGELPNTHSS
jgi:hypothetical protein